MRRKQLLLGLAGGGLLVIGVLAGMLFGDNLRALAAGANTSNAQATPGDKASYCQLYLQKVASELGVTTDKLKSANRDAAQAVIDQLASDGKISATQKTELTQALQKYANSPCAFVNVRGLRHDLDHDIRRALAPARAAAVAAVAGALKISATALESDLAAGQTIPQIATAQKVQVSDVNRAYLNAIKAQLASAGSKGTLTQDQSNRVFGKVQQAVQDGHYPLLSREAHKG